LGCSSPVLAARARARVTAASNSFGVACSIATEPDYRPAWLSTAEGTVAGWDCRSESVRDYRTHRLRAWTPQTKSLSGRNGCEMAEQRRRWSPEYSITCGLLSSRRPVTETFTNLGGRVDSGDLDGQMLRYASRSL
jgi:hypothetical protein